MVSPHALNDHLQMEGLEVVTVRVGALLIVAAFAEPPRIILTERA